MPGLKIPDDLRRAVRGTVIDHQYMKILTELKDRFQDDRDIFFFVIGRYDDDLFQLPDYVDVKLSFFQPFFNMVLLKISVSFCLVCKGKSPFIIQS
jgi:hypothetical protein